MKIYQIALLSIFTLLYVGISPAYAQIDLEEGLIAYYPFSGDPHDASGNNRHGTAIGSLSLRPDRAGNPGNAYEFDGINDGIALGSVFTDLALPFSFSVWLEQPSSASADSIGLFASNYISTAYTGFHVGVSGAGHLSVHYGDGGEQSVTSLRGIESTISLPQDAWVHVVAVIRASDDMSLYVDGKDIPGNLLGFGGPNMVNGENPASIGLYGLSEVVSPWTGGIDDIRIYDRAISELEAQALFTIEPDVNTANPSVIITEIMKNPDDVADSAGEWFELYNITDEPVNLINWTIQDLDTEAHLVNQELVIQPHATLVLCKNAERDLNGDVPCDYQYTGMSLGNRDDEIILLDAQGAEVDRVTYEEETFPSPTGASLFYNAGPGDDNNDGSNWLTSFERAPNYGNTACPACDDLGSPGTVDSGTLPVEMVAFHVVRDGNDAILRWETASETNNAGFEVYRRSGAGAFELMGWVNGAGTTTERRAYTFNAGHMGPGRHAFRLKQIDFDGAFAWSREATQEVQLDKPYAISAPYPNPYNPTTTLSFSVQRDQHVVVELVNLLGQRMATSFDEWAAANTEYQVNISGHNLASGRYMVRVIGASFIETYQVYLVK